MKLLRRMYKKFTYKNIMVMIGIIVTLVAFGLVIAAEVETSNLQNSEKSIEIDESHSDNLREVIKNINKRIEISKLSYTGIILLFVGFILTTLIQAGYNILYSKE